MFADLDEMNAKSAAEESKQFATNQQYKAASLGVDVTDAEQVQHMVDYVIREFGRLDYCVNSAGVGDSAISSTELYRS